MRKLITWTIPFMTGVACQIILQSPTPVFGRLLVALLLGFVASFVFDMALKAYTVQEFQDVTWSVTATVEPADEEQV